MYFSLNALLIQLRDEYHPYNFAFISAKNPPDIDGSLVKA